MTKTLLGLCIIGLLAAGFGLVSVVAAFFFEDLTLLARFYGGGLGLLTVAGGWLVFRRRRIGVALLWLAAAIYTLVSLVPALQAHGADAFSALMSAFYVTVALRVALAAAAHVLLGGRRG
jgi:hypothetical protein